MRLFLELLSNCMCASFLFGFEAGMRDLTALVPDHCLIIILHQIHKNIILQTRGTERKREGECWQTLQPSVSFDCNDQYGQYLYSLFRIGRSIQIN